MYKRLIKSHSQARSHASIYNHINMESHGMRNNLQVLKYSCYLKNIVSNNFWGDGNGIQLMMMVVGMVQLMMVVVIVQLMIVVVVGMVKLMMVVVEMGSSLIRVIL